MMAPASNEELPLKSPAKPLLIVLSGPSGVGKDAVLARLKESGYSLNHVTTMTTRQQRPSERDGVDYHFVSVPEFQEMVKNNELLEWAQVYGNWYGIPKSEVKGPMERGEDVIVKIDVQGAATIKKILPQAVFIFLMPASKEDLRRRLKQRQTESPADFALRLKTADEEMKQVSFFDYVIVNHWGKLDKAVADIMAIITAEKCRVNQREVKL